MAESKVDITTVWNACVDILRKDPRPLEIWAVAKNCGWDETELVTALINYTGPNRTEIAFRFPAIPCAAITGMAARNGSYAVGAYAPKK